MEKFDVIIAGGGPAGLFGAIQIARTGRQVAILEKNRRLGVKLLMSGAGQCNITQAGRIEGFFDCYGDHGKFIKPSLTGFDNKALLDFFKKRGLEFETQDNGKIFPKSRKAKDVLDVLTKECQKNGVRIITECPVEEIRLEGGDFLFQTPKGSFKSSQVVVATGGMSYPTSGSSGDGQRFAKSLGHKIVPMKPSLAPLKIKEYPFADLSGQSFELSYTLWRSGKKVGAFSGPVLLTHRGLSGPGVINPSRYMQKGDVVKLDFTGNGDSVKAQLLKAFEKNGKLLVKTVVRQLDLNRRILDFLLDEAGIGEGLRCGDLKKDVRQGFFKRLTEYELEIKEVGGYNQAMATAGGVSLKDLNPKTLESRRVPGLYFIGEVTDIDGDTGGYNIQAAMAMAFAAAQAIGNK